MTELNSSAVRSAMIVAVTAAIIGGMFTLAPLAYDYYKSQVGISTSLLRSEVLGSDLSKQIMIAEIENSGKVVVEGLNARIDIPDGEFTDVTITVPNGVDVKRHLGRDIQFEVRELNPGETVKVAFLVEAPAIPDGQVLFLRAKGVPSSAITEKTAEIRFPNFFKDNPLLFALVASVYAGFSLWVARQLVRRVFASNGSFDRDDALSFIGRVFFNKDQRDDMFSSGTYRGSADSIFVAFQKGEVDFTSSSMAMLSLYIVRDSMNKRSRELIKKYLISGFGFTEDDLRKSRVNSGDEIRTKIMYFRDNPILPDGLKVGKTLGDDVTQLV